jgi:hypothetical protein
MLRGQAFAAQMPNGVTKSVGNLRRRAAAYAAARVSLMDKTLVQQAVAGAGTRLALAGCLLSAMRRIFARHHAGRYVGPMSLIQDIALVSDGMNTRSVFKGIPVERQGRKASGLTV